MGGVWRGRKEPRIFNVVLVRGSMTGSDSGGLPEGGISLKEGEGGGVARRRGWGWEANLRLIILHWLSFLLFWTTTHD